MKRFLVVAALAIAGLMTASAQADHGHYRSSHSGGGYRSNYSYSNRGCGSSHYGGYGGGYGGYSGYGGYGGYYAPAPVYQSSYYANPGYGYGVPVYGGYSVMRPGISFSYYR